MALEKFKVAHVHGRVSKQQYGFHCRLCLRAVVCAPKTFSITSKRDTGISSTLWSCLYSCIILNSYKKLNIFLEKCPEADIFTILRIPRLIRLIRLGHHAGRRGVIIDVDEETHADMQCKF